MVPVRFANAIVGGPAMGPHWDLDGKPLQYTRRRQRVCAAPTLRVLRPPGRGGGPPAGRHSVRAAGAAKEPRSDEQPFQDPLR